MSKCPAISTTNLISPDLLISCDPPKCVSLNFAQGFRSHATSSIANTSSVVPTKNQSRMRA